MHIWFFSVDTFGQALWLPYYQKRIGLGQFVIDWNYNLNRPKEVNEKAEKVWIFSGDRTVSQESTLYEQKELAMTADTSLSPAWSVEIGMNGFPWLHRLNHCGFQTGLFRPRTGAPVPVPICEYLWVSTIQPFTPLHAYHSLTSHLWVRSFLF